MIELEGPQTGDPEGAGGWDDADLPTEEVRSMLVMLSKAFRAYQLYDENNPVRRRFVDSLKAEFEKLWLQTDRVALTVREDHFFLGGHEVYRSENRADSLAFLFYKDGVREITFLPGIQGDELVRFLSVLQRARKLVPEGDDLLTVLWEEDLQYLQYQYVDLLSEGVTLPEAGAGHTQAELSAVLEAEVDAEEGDEMEEGAPAETAPPRAKTVSQEDFNPTLYALDPKEMQAMQAEIEKEFRRDVRMDVLAALFDRLEEPHNRDRQSEIIQILGTLLPNLLSRGALTPATKILEELRRVEATPGIFDERRLGESRQLLGQVSAPATISELIRALYDGTIRATPSQLGGFLQFMRGAALAPLLHAAETVDHKELRNVLRTAVQGIAQRNRSAVIALLRESDPLVAAGAARLIGDLQVSEAGPNLAELLGHADARVRLAAIESAVRLKASVVAGALQKTLQDGDREVRIAAARALGELRYAPAMDLLGRIVTGKAIREADISEKVAFFEAFGLVAGERGVTVLDELLNARSLLGRKEPSEIRAAAALGLGRIGGALARASLEKAVRDDDAVVRSNVGRALRSEG